MENKINPHNYGNYIVEHMRIKCHMEQLNHIMPMKGYNKENPFFLYKQLYKLESSADYKIWKHQSIPQDLWDNLEQIFGDCIYNHLSINFNRKVGSILRLSIDTPPNYPILKGLDDLIIIAPTSMKFGISVYDKLIFNQKYL